MSISPITNEEFERFRRLIYEHAGISLTAEKKIMVASRLAKRLDYYGFSSYDDYFRLATSPDSAQEFQTLVNILTTNETYFFREPKHFDFLREQILRPWRGERFRIWSAASSTGEEAYSLAMMLAEHLGAMREWDIFASDLSTRVLDAAKRAIYLMDRLEYMDPALMEKYCLKGVRSQEGYFRVNEKLRSRVSFAQVNLMQPVPPGIGRFEVIFLRNVLIYFDQDTKKQVVERLITALQPGGYLFISHSESLYRVTSQLQMVKPSIYRKP